MIGEGPPGAGGLESLLAERFAQAQWLVAEIDRRCVVWRLERHPFLRRLAAGTLRPSDLMTYGAEQHHLVTAMAEIARRAAPLADGLLGDELNRHRAEREHDVELWCAFARATGWSASAAWCYAADPRPETSEAVRGWTGEPDRELAVHLVTLHTLESALAGAARPVLDALLGHYRLPDGDATRFLRRREPCGDGTSGRLQAALTGLLPVTEPIALLRGSQDALRGLWGLLDGVHALTTP